jgi:hypothetical protein
VQSTTTLPVRLTGSALAAAGGGGALTPARVSRQTGRALASLEQQSLVAEAAVTCRAHLIGQATRASLRTSAAIWAEAELLAQLTPSAGQALHQIASASTLGLTNIVLDASA